MLCANARNLEKAGVDFIVIPCNTVHIFLDAIESSVNIPILSIVDATINDLERKVPQVEKVGLLASPAVNATGLYTKKLAARGIQTLIPAKKEEQDVHDVIFAVKAGDKSQVVKDKILKVCDSLLERGAQGLILGCPEIPLILQENDLSVPAIDTLEVLALAAIEFARS
jgi:aspartate racemase